jgi:glycosyltransferase involved in cell wall biosynthesis
MNHSTPHLAYIAWGFPPSRAGGVYRALATANAFASAGWRVTVITVERSVFTRITGADLSLESQVDPSIDVVRLPFPWPLRETDIATFSRFRATTPRLWRKVEATRELIRFPESQYGPWLGALNKALRALHKADPIDLTVATANPQVTCAGAYHLNRTEGVPYVMDYRDAWLLDVFSGDQAHAESSREARLERKYVDHAAEVWFVNEPIRAWHAARYPGRADRFHMVSNGWDPDLLALDQADDGEAGAKAGAGSPRPLTFAYLGTVSGKVPMAELVEGWRLAKASGSLPADARLKIGGYLGFFGNPDPVLTQMLEGAFDDGVEYVGPVPKAKVGSFYRGTDALVLALGAGKYVTSGKVFEYMATGKPIVSVHPPDNAASGVLEGYPLHYAVSEVTADQVATALGEAAVATRDLTPDQSHAASEFAAAYRRDRQLDPRVEALRKEVRP